MHVDRAGQRNGGAPARMARHAAVAGELRMAGRKGEFRRNKKGVTITRNAFIATTIFW